MVSELFSHNTCSYIDPHGVASFDPSSLIGRIYEGDYWKLLHIKYISCGPNGFRRSFAQVLSLWELYVLFPQPDESLHEISSH